MPRFGGWQVDEDPGESCSLTRCRRPGLAHYEARGGRVVYLRLCRDHETILTDPSNVPASVVLRKLTRREALVLQVMES